MTYIELDCNKPTTIDIRGMHPRLLKKIAEELDLPLSREMGINNRNKIIFMLKDVKITVWEA